MEEEHDTMRAPPPGLPMVALLDHAPSWFVLDDEHDWSLKVEPIQHAPGIIKSLAADGFTPFAISAPIKLRRDRKYVGVAMIFRRPKPQKRLL